MGAVLIVPEFGTTAKPNGGSKEMNVCRKNGDKLPTVFPHRHAAPCRDLSFHYNLQPAGHCHDVIIS